MIVELAIALLAFAGLLFWLGTDVRWRWAVAVSAIPIVLLFLILREFGNFYDTPLRIEQWIVGVFLAVFLFGWASFGLGTLVSRNRRRKVEQEIK